ARSCLPSLLKSPIATEHAFMSVGTSGALVKLAVVQLGEGVNTVRLKVLVVTAPTLSNDFTVIRYEPAGCASVTLTTPVAGFPPKVPLKFVEVETFIFTAPTGATA